MVFTNKLYYSLCMNKKSQLQEKIEQIVERLIFASRWLMAPVYGVLCLSLSIIMLKVIQEFLHYVLPLSHLWNLSNQNLLLFILHIVDMALVGNLVLMIIFAGYENFVSKIESARQSADKPSWMGKVGFSGLKLKLIASIVAISGINLLETFLSVADHDDRVIRWQIILHVVFLGSGVFLAMMDYIASKAEETSVS